MLLCSSFGPCTYTHTHTHLYKTHTQRSTQQDVNSEQCSNQIFKQTQQWRVKKRTQKHISHGQMRITLFLRIGWSGVMCPLVCRKVPLMGFLQHTAKTCMLRVPPSVHISRVLWDRVQVCVCVVLTKLLLSSQWVTCCPLRTVSVSV